jgi:hypothetical protein
MSHMMGTYFQAIWARDEEEQALNEELNKIGSMITNGELYSLFHKLATEAYGTLILGR